ncbi:MAG: 5-formyltetrahydrofolate cyclo-ligase [Bacillota bacterium]|jgi:5-formyltetrahydrofolate cyclo-ligase
MKKEMRKVVLQARQAMTREIVQEKSIIICSKIAQIETFRKAKIIMAYLPFRNEVDVTLLFPSLWDQGKRIVIPLCDTKNKALIPSELKSMERDLQPGVWGILEPKPGCVRPVAPQEIDFVIVPGVSFDPSCNRLGYGGGYYDRFLPQLRNDAPKIAVAFEIQIVADTAPKEFDFPMDGVITESCVYNNFK